jgi:DNA-binding Lrp family transcriptional regulator
MDATDRLIVNTLQGGFPVCEAPFAAVAADLGIAEQELVDRIGAMTGEGVLSRFGPLYHAERMGGAQTLAAMQVPTERFDTVAVQVNAHPEVAHNYARDHILNMWFVIASDDPAAIDRVIGAIEAETGLVVYNMPKEEEFFIGLRFTL